MSETKKTLRVALIGCGFMGKTHSNAWRQVSHFFPLKADLDLNTIYGFPNEVATAPKQFGWKNGSTDWRAVVNNSDIDVVDIVTPNNVHAEIAIAAAKAGKHILCEKPLAMNVKECEQMLGAGHRSGQKTDRGRRPRHDLSFPRPLCSGLDRQPQFPARLASAQGGQRQ